MHFHPLLLINSDTMKINMKILTAEQWDEKRMKFLILLYVLILGMLLVFVI